MTFSAISLYSGAGGLDYGLEAAGFEVAAALEMDADCCSTLRLNRDWRVLEKDVHAVKSKEILSLAGLRRGSVDLLFGGPPCQPFSKAAFWSSGDTQRMADPRAQTLNAYMRLVEDLQPEVFLLENVQGIAYTGKEEGFKALKKLTEQVNKRTGAGYETTSTVLSTADYGVPQFRTRFFMTGRRGGGSFSFPKPTHFDPTLVTGQRTLTERPHQAWTTAWDAIGELQPEVGENLAPKGFWKDLLPSIPEGENYLWHTDRGGGLPLFGWRTRYWSFLLKLAKSRPSWTIPAQPGPAIGPFHWSSRYLSVKELAALQTFPSDMEFVGGRVSVQKQIGNAVPSLMAEVLGRAIIESVFHKRPSGSPKLMVKAHRPIPPPEPVLPVPAEYLGFVGKHAAHPGTGRGHEIREKAEPRPAMLAARA